MHRASAHHAAFERVQTDLPTYKPLTACRSGMTHSHAPQGLPPPLPFQHPRSAGLIQQHPPNSPHQSQNFQPSSQGPFISSHSSTHSLPPQYHSPYVGTIQDLPPQQPQTTYFGAHPSPYSTNSAAGSYASSDQNEHMATQTAMSRQPYPPISSYHTPQSNSPASVQSPQHDAHGRAMYGHQMPSMAQPMYYPQYQIPQHSPYGQHPSAPQHHPMTSAPGMLMSHQHSQQQSIPPHAPAHQSSAQMIDQKPSIASLQRPPTGLGPPHGAPNGPQGPAMHSMPQPGPTPGPGSNPNAAPGPIPATTPLVVRQDGSGVQWIAFEYSRDRVKMEYTIRCDVESVNVDELSQEFRSANCVYPRACCGKDQYKGNRLHYESECNAVGWALAQLNPNLREKRGLIQRAVDSWRNSNQDVRLRSRRVRRMAKISTRKSQTGSAGGQMPPGGPPSAGVQTSAGMGPGAPRPQGMGLGSQSMLQSSSDGAGDDVSAGNEYHNAPAHHHQPPSNAQDLTTPTDVRYAQSFYPTYAQPPSSGPPIPSVHDGTNPIMQQSSTLAAPISAAVKEDDEEDKKALFGDLPEAKRRKFILVNDDQRGTRVRVRVMLDQVKMDDMPDAHLRTNAVYPRSYYPRQMRSPPGSPSQRGLWDDEGDEEEGASGVAPTRGKTFVPVHLMDNTEAKLAVPRMTKRRRAKEVALNELGYRMSWGQARTFNGRTLFLQRSLDAYRSKMRSTMIAGGQDPATIAQHFETRPGKRKWLEHSKRSTQAASP